MRMRSICLRLLFGLLLLGMLTACGAKEKENRSGSASDEAQEAQEKTGDKVFGTFQSQTLEGEDVTQEVFAGADLTMVNIWGTFCGPCIQEMPDLGEISRTYEGRGFQIVGIISDVEEPQDEAAQEIIESTGADYMHIIASKGLQLNVLGRVSVVPTTVFVDKEGAQVGDVYSGSRSKEEWTAIIEELLGEVQP